MDVLKHKNDYDHMLVAEYTTKIKTYANGEQNIVFHSYSNLKGYGKKKKCGTSLFETKESSERQNYKNLLRAKTNIIDLIYHNGLIRPWEYFVTLTFNPIELDSFDYNQVSSVIKKWLNNMKHQNPDMSYVMTPELHKSGRIHWHGVFRDVPNWKLVRSKSPTGKLIYKNGMKIYNLDNYKYGYTTVSFIENQEAVSVYVSKYITKDLIEKDYKKRYWSSKNLERPMMQYAMLDESGLKLYIYKHKVKDYCTKETKHSCSIFCKLETCIIYIMLTANYYIQLTIFINLKNKIIN